MDIHIILNPGAVGTPSNAQLSKKQKQTPRRGSRSRTPTSAELLQRSSRGSGSAAPAIHRRSSLRAKSQSKSKSKSSSNEFTVGLGSQKKSYDATPATLIHPIRQRHSSTVRQPQPPASSPLVRQSRTRKRVAELGFEGELEDRDVAPPPPKRGRRRRGSTSTHSSRSSAGSSATMFDLTAVPSRAPSRASLLLSCAKEHVALEAVALGRRSRSMMDVVMDLKGPAEEDAEYQEDGVVMFIQDRSRSRRHALASYLGHDYLLTDDASYSYLRRRGKNNSEYVLTDDEGLAAYWEEQAAIWMHVDVGAASGFHSKLNASANSDSDSDWAEVALTRFPMSMERSTAAWESS